MSRIACIGSRSTPSSVLAWMEEAGANLVRAGHTIVSGNAPGADQAWARGGNSVNPAMVELCLPWRYFEMRAVVPGNAVRVYQEGDRRFDVYRERAERVHGRWSALSAAGQRLHARNAMILSGVARVMFWLDRSEPYGGTRVGIGLAELFGIPIYDVAKRSIREALDWAAIAGPIFP